MLTLDELRKLEIEEDKGLLPLEKETHISFDNETCKDGFAKIQTYQKSIIKQMLNNDSFELDRYYLDDDGKIVYLAGKIDLSSLRVNSTSNKDNNSLWYITRN